MNIAFALVHGLLLGVSAWMIADAPHLLAPWLSAAVNFAGVIYFATRERVDSR